MEEYPFISEIEGDIYLEPRNYDGRRVALTEIFELYTSPDIEADDVARLKGIDESDVMNAVFYWTEEPEVYEELVEEANLESDSEIFSENVLEGQPSSETSALPAKQDDFNRKENLGRKRVSNPVNPLHVASNTFLDLREDQETHINESNIFDDPDESYLGDDIVESHVEWRRNGFRLGLYAGWNLDEGVETGLVSYSVEGEVGEVFIVDRDKKKDDETDPMEKMIRQAYNNAIFESRNRK